MIYFRFVINFYVKSGKATTFVLIDLILYALQISNVFFLQTCVEESHRQWFCLRSWTSYGVFHLRRRTEVRLLSYQHRRYGSYWSLGVSRRFRFHCRVAIMHPLQPKESIFELKIQLYVLMVLNRKPIFNRETLLKTDEKWTRVNSNTGHYVGS